MYRRTLLALAYAATAFAEAPDPSFRAITIADRIQIGYGLAIADVDGDGLADVLLADKKQFVWYRNPGPEKARQPAAWDKFLLAENLTPKDNVCIAAQDIDGDGKCEIAVGAEWNPGDTINSGAVFYLQPPPDRTKPWAAVKFPAVEPTTHRMRWLQLAENRWGLVVAPLHGRGNKNGEGEPVRVLVYHPPADGQGEWKADVLSQELHATHNFEIVRREGLGHVLVAGREGVIAAALAGSGRSVAWRLVNADAAPAVAAAPQVGVPAPTPGFRGAGEIRSGRLPEGHGFLATVEPMHGNELAVYRAASVSDPKPGGITRLRLTNKLVDGHALACGDVLGTGSDQIVVGWRGKPGAPGSTTGVAVWAPEDAEGTGWEETAIDPDGMACEDLQLADLDGDGRLDIVAAGRATKNVKIYFNETPRRAP